MELLQTFTVTKKQINWLLKGASLDSHREVLGYGRLESYKGKTYLVTTDAHRLHAVLVAGRELPVGALVDVKRLSHELRFDRMAKGVKFSIESDGRIGAVEIVNKDDSPIETVGRKVVTHDNDIDRPKITYPNWTRILPDGEGLPEGKIDASFNFRYLADASMLATECACRVHLTGINSSRAFVVAPLQGDYLKCDWFAVIMPMAIVTVEETEKSKKATEKANKELAERRKAA